MSALTLPQVGQEAPDFKLRGPGGAFYTLNEYRGDKGVILVFYPFAFSALCSHQLPEAQAIYVRAQAAGIEMFGVSVDSYHSAAAFARSLKLTFPLLSDWDRAASRAYGVLIEGPNFADRAVFAIDKAGRIAYAEVTEDLEDEAKFPSPEKALAALGA
jgi:peroxiredoxin